MGNSSSTFIAVCSAIAIACTVAFYPEPAAAQTAKKLNCNGCVKSKQLKNSGIKSKDIKDGQVTAPDLGSNAVTGAKIAPDAVDGAKIADGAVGNADLGAGSVSGDKIADGAIGAAKLGLANTIYLEDTGSDLDNCTALLDALAGLTGPAAVVLGPGIYACGSNQVVLTSKVSLIGSGENLTTITGSFDTGDGFVLLLGDDIALRDLTVINDVGAGAGITALGVKLGGGPATRNWRISDVTVEVKSTSIATVGLHLTTGDCGGGEMANVTVTASAEGVSEACNGSFTATNLTATATGRGLAKFGPSSLTVRNSSSTGATSSVHGANGTLKVISSELDGPVTTTSGTIICVGAYNEDGVALGDGTFGAGLSCDTM